MLSDKEAAALELCRSCRLELDKETRLTEYTGILDSDLRLYISQQGIRPHIVARLIREVCGNPKWVKYSGVGVSTTTVYRVFKGGKVGPETELKIRAVLNTSVVTSAFFGSYVSTVALHQYLGGNDSGYFLMKAVSQGSDHYWVKTKYGDVLDPLYHSSLKEVYRRGTRVQKRNTMVEHLNLLNAMKNKSVSGEKSRSVDLFHRPLAAIETGVLTDAQTEVLRDAWRALVRDWADRPDEFIRCTFPKGALAVYFVRAMLYGEEIPRTATMAYTWDRYYVAGNAVTCPFNEMLPAAVRDDKILRGVRFALNDELSFNKLIAGNLPIGGYRMPFDFPISLARGLIDKYCPAGGHVLDPCHGWGGRMVGWMLSKASSYTGVDPAPHSPKLREMFDDLSEYLFEPKALKLINKPFEDVRLTENKYDFALTSPPYFNTEKYKGEDSSWRRYKTLDDWIDGFYRELIVGAADAIKPGAYFVLQVTTKFKMVEVAREICTEVGLDYIGVEDTNMKRYNSVSSSKSAETDPFEVFTVFRKRT